MKPGIYDMAPEVYHGSPALSSSGARKLLPPSCPALFHYERSNPFTPTAEMEFGSVTHALLLGEANRFEVLDYDTYRTKEAQEKRDAIREVGLIPILRHDFRVAEAMVATVRRHPLVEKLKLFAGGKAEQSLFWIDPSTGTPLRARLDYLKLGGRRPVIVDFKTTSSVHPDELGKDAWNYGYCQQGDFYTEAVRALELGADPAFLTVSQMKTPPYLVTVGQFSETSRMIGRDLNRRAIELFAQCTETGEWPGFDDGIATISLPGWIETKWMKDLL